MLIASSLFGESYPGDTFLGDAYRTLWDARMLGLVREELGGGLIFDIGVAQAATMPEARDFPVAPRLVIRRDHSGYISDLRIFADPLVRLDTPLEPFSTLEDGSAVVDFHAGYSSGIPTFDVVAVMASPRRIPAGLEDALIRSRWLVLLDDLHTHSKHRWTRACRSAREFAVMYDEEADLLVSIRGGDPERMSLADVVGSLWRDAREHRDT